jgi:hypothetical protein
VEVGILEHASCAAGFARRVRGFIVSKEFKIERIIFEMGLTNRKR